ncbi:lantibiotic protection ABC transporter ATP-binding protein [Clostridium sp.]|uniref:lantibiotic protection ABC transporter ATP-binding protein n=1 Tax=Clostridium sp. TaxID=1506 RepID=UPI00262D5A63|nr:lantibiotic protection ABC transporter ATP-binding protein [Clostridium sp.]
MEKYIIETDKLTKRFGKQIAVNNISLKVKQNVIYGLLGPNGAGKSTTLKLITGLLHPTSGQIIFNGEKWSRKKLEDIGALIETPALYGNLTAKENLEVYIKLLNLPKSRIDEVLEIVDLKNTNKKKASQFSLGMKQRLGIAIALLNHPKLLILDEPTNGLDPIGIQELRNLIKSFPRRGITVILSSHILSEVEQVADYIGIISDGKLGYQDKIEKDQDLEKLFMEVVKECNSKEEV